MDRNRALARVRETRLAIARLTLFRSVFHSPEGDAYLGALVAVEEVLATGGQPAALVAFAAFGRLFAALAELPWQGYLIERIASADNAFTRAAERAEPNGVPAHLLTATEHDLRVLQGAYRLGVDELRDTLEAALPEAASLPRYAAAEAGDGALADPFHSLRARFAAATDWATCVDDLAEHVRRHGAGFFGRYLAFRWVRRAGRGRLEGIERPDPIRLSQLIGYEAERAQVIDNTERFLAGLPASNVLLYGDRGTGKSSTVKALLHEYGGRGLRLIEMSKRHLLDFPGLARALAGRARRFIVFIDDLSFEEHEVTYKELKAILEGGIEVRPDNVLVYATSNRRHLIKEMFADRQIETHPTGDGEVRRQDTLQEKLSLSDRFGLTVIFPTPDQEQYLEIVAALARERGIALPPAELRQRALRWELYHNGRSGRTARQFVESLVGSRVDASP